MAFQLDHHLHQLADLLHAYDGILYAHPNDLNLSVLPPSWVLSSHDLLKYYMTGHLGELPDDLRAFLDSIRNLKLPRNPVRIPNSIPISTKNTKGMTPKKVHEVQQMVGYIKALAEANSGFQSSEGPNGPLHIVDIGAGQGYLTRALANLFPEAQLLALDADHEQTTAAETKLGKEKIRSRNTEMESRITHKTALIKSASLLKAVDDWVAQTSPHQAVPVLFVALHACGSLTPDILRAFVDSRSRTTESWHLCSLLAVGCCYNLMYPGDCPLSSTLKTYPPSQTFPLPASAYHLAAQVPETWLNPTPSQPISEWRMYPSIELSTRKIVWRALLGRALKSPHAKVSRICESLPEKPIQLKKSAEVPVKWWLEAGNETRAASSLISPPGSRTETSFALLPMLDHEDPALQERRNGAARQTATAIRLGKLPDSAYTQGWQHFLQTAGKKLGVEWDFSCEDDCEEGGLAGCFASFRDIEMERQIETLHVLRCLLGPAIESTILLDRLAWLREQLSVEPGKGDSAGSKVDRGDGLGWETGLVNLFDQQMGSGRNVGICVAPSLPKFKISR